MWCFFSDRAIAARRSCRRSCLSRRSRRLRAALTLSTSITTSTAEAVSTGRYTREGHSCGKWLVVIATVVLDAVTRQGVYVNILGDAMQSTRALDDQQLLAIEGSQKIRRLRAGTSRPGGRTPQNTSKFGKKRRQPSYEELVEVMSRFQEGSRPATVWSPRQPSGRSVTQHPTDTLLHGPLSHSKLHQTTLRKVADSAGQSPTCTDAHPNNEWKV